MRLATWNINGTKARLAYILHWLEDIKPDVVGFQELKMTDEQFPSDVFRNAGYHSVTHGQKGWNGVAILSREPATVTQTGLPGQEEIGARLLTAQVSGISFTTVYVPNGKTITHEDFKRKLGWLDSLHRYFETSHKSSDPVVLTGDFNVVPAAIDSWSEERLGTHIFHTPEERSILKRIQSWGLTDSFRHLRPEDPGFTWWDYRAGAFHKKQGLRIDLMFVSQPLVGRLSAVTVERKYRKKIEGLIPSDHAPLWVDFE
ncbi:MAG: exodeoxyribonuclease III [Myxococcota bacterium]